MHKYRTDNGFTLMEMLIVIAIIAVLIAIAIPIFTSQLEKSREATDLANVRAAYAEVMAAAISSDDSAQHDGNPIKQADGSFKAVVSPLSQQMDGWTTDVSNMSIGDVASADWIGQPTAGGACTVAFSPSTNEVVISWAGVYGLTWNGLNGKVINTDAGGNYYGTDNQSKQNKKAAYDELTATPNEARKAADIDALNSMANYFNGKTVDEVKAILGDGMFDRASKNNGILFNYQVDGGGSYSVRLNPDGATKNTDYFSALGYNPQVHSMNTDNTAIGNFNAGTNNYVDTYFFTSDEVIGDLAKEKQVRIGFKVVDGKITDTNVWIYNARSEMKSDV